MMKAYLKVLSLVGLCILHSAWSLEQNGDPPSNDLDTAENNQPANKRNASLDHFDFMSRLFTNIGKKTDNLSRSYRPGVCPDGWLKYRNSCYYFSRYNTNWFESLMFCHIMGGYLAEITSYSENAFLKQQASYRRDSFWLGGTDLVKEYHWMWVRSQRRVSTMFSDWDRNQPDNHRGKEHCMAIERKFDAWNDDDCRDLLKFICEKDLK